MAVIIHRNYEIKYVSFALICMPDSGQARRFNCIMSGTKNSSSNSDVLWHLGFSSYHLTKWHNPKVSKHYIRVPSAHIWPESECFYSSEYEELYMALVSAAINYQTTGFISDSICKWPVVPKLHGSFFFISICTKAEPLICHVVWFLSFSGIKFIVILFLL